MFNMKVDSYNWQHNTLTQAHLCYCRLIINSSLPIGCQFIWETKLTLKSQMILEKSWWSCLVVAIVIAIVIAVVIVKVWSSPFSREILCTLCGIPCLSVPFVNICFYKVLLESSILLKWVATMPALQRRKGEGEGSSWCSGKLTWKSTDWTGHRHAFYTQRADTKPIREAIT